MNIMIRLLEQKSMFDTTKIASFEVLKPFRNHSHVNYNLFLHHEVPKVLIEIQLNQIYQINMLQH